MSEYDKVLADVSQQALLVREEFEFDYSPSATERITARVAPLQAALNALEKQDEEQKVLTRGQRAKLFYLQGYILDTFPNYDKNAESFLNKSVKLEPAKAEVWIALGHVLYKKNSYQESLQAYENAINEGGRGKVALREQSVVLRQVGQQGDRMRNMSDSISLAKEALTLDLKDGVSWYFVANAYMYNFFVNMKNLEELDHSLKAYKKAEELLRFPNADLHFNRGNIHSYLQNYQLAIKDYRRAQELDPSLKGAAQIKKIEERLQATLVTIASQQTLKPKQLVSRVNQIPDKLKRQPKGDTLYTPCALSDLALGVNKGAGLIAQVVRSCSGPSQVPASFVFQSKCGRQGVVSVYNCKSQILEYLRKGAIVNIFDPLVKEVRAEGGSFLAVQVFQISKLLVDNEAVSDLFLPNVIVRNEVIS